MFKNTSLSLAVLATLSFTGIAHAQNYTQSNNYSEDAIYGKSNNSSISSNVQNNSASITTNTQQYNDQAIYAKPGSSSSNVQTQQYGTTQNWNQSSSNYSDEAIYNKNTSPNFANENALDPTGQMNTSTWVVAPENKGTPNGYNIDNTPKSEFVDQQTAMGNWTFSNLHCNQITRNLHFKGLADYLQLWNPPIDSIDDQSYAKVPLFAMTDLIYNNINYGKGAVLLGSATIMNQNTGNVNSQMSNAPVTINDCNVTWVIPDSIVEQLEKASKESTAEGDRKGFSPEAVTKLNADIAARQNNARANGFTIPLKVYNADGFYTRR